MLKVLFVEARKLASSKALWIVFAAPALVSVVIAITVLCSPKPAPWSNWLETSASFWAFFMLPMSATVLTSMAAQIEHVPRAWDHLRSLPVARWKIYAAKAACVLAIVLGMSVLNVATTVLAVKLAGLANASLAPSGDVQIAHFMVRAVEVACAAVLLTAIQFWAAMRFASIGPALSLGIAGTFFGVVATIARQSIFVPWQMPLNVLAKEPSRVEMALLLGGGGGVVAMALAIIHLSKREVV